MLVNNMAIKAVPNDRLADEIELAKKIEENELTRPAVHDADSISARFKYVGKDDVDEASAPQNSIQAAISRCTTDSDGVWRENDLNKASSELATRVTIAHPEPSGQATANGYARVPAVEEDSVARSTRSCFCTIKKIMAFALGIILAGILLALFI